MSFFQKCYDIIKSWQPPSWVKDFIQSLNDLIISIATQVGQDYIQYLKSEIIFASTQSWTSKEKFDYVFKQAKNGFTQFAITLKDNEINSLINVLVSMMKKDRIIT